MQTTEQTKIIGQARSGDTAAYAALLAEYGTVIRSVLRRDFGWFLSRTGRQLSHDDLQSEAIFALIQAVHTHDPERGEFGAYARVKIRFHLLKVIAKYENPIGRYFVPLSGQDAAGDDFDLSEYIEDPAASYRVVEAPERAQIVQDLHAIMDDLEPIERALIRLRYGFDGPAQSPEKIAKFLGVSARNVRSVINAGLDKLRQEEWLQEAIGV